MDTLPMSLDAVAAAHGGLDDFRVATPVEVHALLKQLADGNVVLNLNGSDGSTYTTTLWTLDTARGVIGFSAHANSNAVQALLEADEVVAVAYVDNVKLQFEVQDLVLVRGAGNSVLSAPLPQEVFRFQRRGGYRVRPTTRNTPTAQMRHPMIPDMTLSLRVLDISIGGCALFLPENMPTLDPGVVLNGVRIDLDLDTRITVTLRMQHVTCVNPDAHGVRMGCEFVRCDHETLKSLQRYIDHTQKRQRMLAK
jgi:c-di-GMP-binding flagellar brake protein YcgR